MFGKIGQDFKHAAKWMHKSARQTFNNLDAGSKYFGKQLHNLEKGYSHVKKVVYSTADKIDDKLGTGDSIRGLAELGYSRLEHNKNARQAKDYLDGAKDYNKAFRDIVIDNPQIRGFLKV
jgi:hypothetical protein